MQDLLGSPEERLPPPACPIRAEWPAVHSPGGWVQTPGLLGTGPPWVVCVVPAHLCLVLGLSTWSCWQQVTAVGTHCGPSGPWHLKLAEGLACLGAPEEPKRGEASHVCLSRGWNTHWLVGPESAGLETVALPSTVAWPHERYLTACEKQSKGTQGIQQTWKIMQCLQQMAPSVEVYWQHNHSHSQATATMLNKNTSIQQSIECVNRFLCTAERLKFLKVTDKLEEVILTSTGN